MDIPGLRGIIARMLEPHCKNCYFWALNRPGALDLPRDGAYGCNKAREFRNTGDPTKPGSAFWSDEGIGVLTGPEFGCVHFVSVQMTYSCKAGEEIKTEVRH
jgi:hypothetical protein